MQSQKYPQKQSGVPRSCLGRSTGYSHGLSLSEVGGGKVNHGVMVTNGD